MDCIISIHQRTQLIAYVGIHICRISLGYLLHALDFCVVLLFLCWCRVYDLLILRLQVIQYIFNFTRCALNFFVQRDALLYCRDRSICSS